MTVAAPAAHELERRKRVRLKLRGDLSRTVQKYEGRTYYVYKDPVTLRYYRFKEQEDFLLGFMDGKHTLDESQQEYEKRFRPERLTLEDLEGFAQQLLTAGLVQNESPRAGHQLIDRRKKRKRRELMQMLTNVLYIRIPLFDPDVLLKKMLPYCGFFFSIWFFALSLSVMMGAILLVTTHFDTFRSKLPSYHEFFSFSTVVYLWCALGIVKVIHEFGHGLSCKKFGGEVHEMGLLFLVFSPAMYCNVSDSWMLPNKWKRIIISAAGIYVELIIAAIATFVWWNTPTQPFINNLSLSLMVICSVSTVVFNANPLMRYDGYYVLADWIEIPNLRERANRYLKNLFCEHCLGIEVQPEPYMALWRRVLFVVYAVVSYIYRWVITYFILYFLYNFLRPYKLGVISGMLACLALGSMIGWPLYNLGKNIHRRGRLPDMKPVRVTITLSVFAAIIIAIFTVPLPVSRVYAEGVIEVQPDDIVSVYVKLADKEDEKTILQELYVQDGQVVKQGDQLARFSNRQLESSIALVRRDVERETNTLASLVKERDSTRDEREQALFAASIRKTKGALESSQEQVKFLEHRLNSLRIVVAPRAGTVMGLPRVDAIRKEWDRKHPLCKIGDPTSLRVLIPVVPSDYALLQENLGGRHEGEVRLPVNVRVPGHGRGSWMGEVSKLPESEAATIPFTLSSKANGPVPIKPSNNPEELVPQTQQYLVSVELTDPDVTIRPGVRAHVKIHCKKRTLGWWLWRKVNDVFNLGLI
jgi:putative peptide zinc metalloprotease protein